MARQTKKAKALRAHQWRIMARVDAWHAQDHRCKYCRSNMVRREVTSDHVVPKSNGGTDHENIVAACRSCNRSKGSIPVKIFMQMLKDNREPKNFGVYLCGVRYRLNRRTDKAVANILAVA